MVANADLGISLYVCVGAKTIPWELRFRRIVELKNSRVIYA